MTETGLLIDPETGLERVPYSLRHYFATQALLRGEDDHTVARWMGTSVAMLERTYNKIKLRMLGARLAGKGKKDALSRTAALLRRQQGDEQPDIADAPDWWRHGP